MRIVHVHHYYWPVVGGLERSIESIAKELVKLGHDVHVITSMFGAEDRPREEVVDNVYIHRVEALRLHFPDLTIPLKVPREVLEKADVIICWSQNSYFTYRVCKDAKKLIKPLAVYFIGVDYLKHHYNPFIRVFGFPYQKWITQKIARLADVALVTNEYEKELLKRSYPIDAIVLPHGIDEIYLKLPNMAKRFREKYGVDGRFIAYIGRIHPTKGIDLLVRAYAKIAEAEPDLQLVIAGKGDARFLRKCLDIAKKLGIGNKVRYLGYLPEEDKIGLIDAADLVVLPSKHAGESYPLVIDEVKARGRSLVVTNRGILPYRVKNMVEGVVVNADVDGIAKGIKRALDNIHTFRVVETPRMWSEVARELVGICEKVIKL